MTDPARTLRWHLLGHLAQWLALTAILTLCGCAHTQSTTTVQPDGSSRTVAASLSVLSDHSTSRSNETGSATDTGRRAPDPTVAAMRPVISAGIGLVVLGGILTILRAKFPVVPIGASLGLVGLGAGLIALGGFMPTLAANWWLILGAAVIAGVLWGPALIANWQDLRKRKENGLHAEDTDGLKPEDAA